MKKILYIIIILFLIIFVKGCKFTDNEQKVPVLVVEETVIALKVGEKKTVVPLVDGNATDLEVDFSSSDNLIVSIINGELSAIAVGKVIVTLTLKDYPTVKTEIQVIVENNLVIDPLQQAKDKIEQIKITIDEQIPYELTQDISMPRFLENYTVSLNWSTSNLKALDTVGRVYRTNTDQYVTINVTIVYKNVIGEFVKTVNVKKVTFPSFQNKKLTFAYLFDSTYKNIRDEDLERIDVINYSFGWIVNGKLNTNHLVNLSNVIRKAHNFGVRVVLAVGGWGGKGFSETSRTKETRTIFINSIIDSIKKLNLDGIDLDWEYPTSSAAGIVSDPSDRANLTLLIKELRETFDLENPNLILSCAVAGGVYATTAYYEIAKINQYLNYFHIMTYDLIDYSSFLTSHHANLYSSKYDNTSADAAIKAYISAGADAQKIMLGIAFYGHIGTVEGSSENGMNLRSPGFASSISYTNIHNQYLTNSNFIQYKDEEAKASWLFDGTTFITYDNPYSIENKCNYVNANNLGGVMFWDMNADTTGTLVTAIYNNLNK